MIGATRRWRVSSLRPILVTLALFAAGAGFAMTASPASADTAPVGGLPSTVSADALPTWQVNGVVWSQVVVGNNVYVTGKFTQARPPGVAAGGAGSVAANNMFAYNITTGNPVGNFSHQLNAQGLVVRASPDGSRVYVGGDFTTVDGVARNHIAAFNTATGALDTAFHPSIASQVQGIAVSSTTVYAGGNFQSAGGQTRRRLAAFGASNGAMLAWAPTADDGKVQAMVLSPDGSRVIVGGRFTTMNNVAASGMGSVDSTTGATMPWAANQRLTNGGTDCAITDLSVDNNQVYGGGMAFGCGNFEGVFGADPNTGALNFVNDCHGDTYDSFPVGQVVYTVSHAHNCSFIGDFPNSSPSWSVNMRHALAFTTYPTGMNAGVDDYGWDYTNLADSTLLQWYPELKIGSVTGQSQAAWTVAANNQYVVLGGEFPAVNGTNQQGLTRFAVSGSAPNKRGPTKAPAAPAPSAQSFTGGQARIAWQSAYDMDNEALTYSVYRSGTTPPIYTTTSNSTYWDYPMLGYIDKGLTPGAKYTYTVRATDPFGNTLTLGTSPQVTVASGSQSQYAQDVADDGASSFWRLGEPSGTTVYDHVGFNDDVAQGGVSRGVTGAIQGDSDQASSFDGASDGFAVGTSTQTATPDFTLESWINTTTNQGGKVVGYGNANTGDSSNYDRHVYMDNAGHIIFGVYNNGTYTITTPKTYNDGSWHQIVATLDSTNGMALYVDGKKIGVNQGTTVGQPYAGYWRIGGDNLNGWPNQPSSSYFNGAIDDVSLYPSTLNLAKVQQHYVDSGRSLGSIPPPPTDTYGQAIYNAAPDLYWRLGDAAGSSAKDVMPGQNDGVITGGVSLQQPGAVTGTSDTAMAFNGSDGTIGSSALQAGPSVYSEELWFKTSTTSGGKLIGFGNAQSGNSSAYDRHVYMENSGQLTFGTWTGTTNTATSAGSFNDGQWHHMVAAQGPDGMHLYVDGAQVASNPQTSQQAYDGYWRVGGDSDWGGDSPYLNGTIDEVAVYSYELTPSDVNAHYVAGGGSVPGNEDPTAFFTESTSGLKVSFDGSDSSDSDGTIASYAWDFGDGAVGTGDSPDHTYGAGGDYTVSLTVTDNQGGTDTTAHTVHVTNNPPAAAFTTTQSGLSVSADSIGSSDSDGTITSYDWDWGDGSPISHGATSSHTYGAADTYTVTLTVTDNANGTDSVTHDVAVTNSLPHAAFTTTQSALTVSTDSIGSSDSDGTITSYDWDWGDGKPVTHGATSSHTYDAANTYTVTLTVTDNAGGTATAQHTVTTTDATPTLLASDDFGRTTTNGWGSADQGGAWTLSGSKANFAVGSGVGTIKLNSPGVGPSINLNSVSSTTTDTRVVFSTDKVATGSGSYFSVMGRSVPSVGNYRASVNIKSTGAVTVSLVRVDGGGQATIAAPVTVNGLTVAAGDKIDVRLVVSGTSPTSLMAKVWKDGTTEPTAWRVTGSDSSAAMQAAGGIGLMYYVAGNATNAPLVGSVDGLRVYDSTTTQGFAAQAKAAAPAADAVVHKSVTPNVRQRVSPPYVVRRDRGR